MAKTVVKYGCGKSYDAYPKAEWDQMPESSKEFKTMGCKTHFDWTSKEGDVYHVVIW